jgi:hypothetical protein
LTLTEPPKPGQHHLAGIFYFTLHRTKLPIYSASSSSPSQTLMT